MLVNVIDCNLQHSKTHFQILLHRNECFFTDDSDAEINTLRFVKD